MHRSMLVLAMAAVMTLVGCVPQPQQQPRTLWVNPAKNYAQIESDINECNYEATKATASIRNTYDQRDMRNNLYTMCMRNKGNSLQAEIDIRYPVELDRYKRSGEIPDMPALQKADTA